MNGEYLKDLFDPDDFTLGSFQLIKAGTGAGKTTFAIEVLSKKFKNVLYLIDTTKAKKQLLHRDECIGLWESKDLSRGIPDEYMDEFITWINEKITVMTYSQFGHNCRGNKKFSSAYDLIVCDEIHHLIDFTKWDDAKGLTDRHTSNNHMALDVLVRTVEKRLAVVVALTATPRVFLQKFRHMTTIVKQTDPTKKIRSYDTLTKVSYKYLQPLLASLKPNEKGLIYVPQIRQMENCVEYLEQRGIHAVAIWSENNEDHKMSDEQLEVNDHLIEHSKIKDNVQVLVINKACETSVNIETPLDYIIVHTSDRDTITQVRGRFRGDLNTLYVYNQGGESSIVLDDKWLNRPLKKSDKDELCKELGIKINGRLQKWPTVKKVLTDCGYTISEKKSDKTRSSFITE